MTDSSPVATKAGSVRPQTRADVSGVIRSVRALSIGGTPACQYTLADGTGELDLLFLGRVQVAGLAKGRHCRVEGMAALRDGRIVIWNPRYWIQPDEEPDFGPGIRSNGGAPAWSPTPRNHPSAATPRILIVDDDKAICRVLELSLAAYGFQVDVAATAQEAVDLAGLAPDLILLDIGLPDMNGLLAITEIQAQCDAPIIVISAREMVAARTAALAAGATEFLAKPFSIDDVLAKIRAASAFVASPELAGSGAVTSG